MRRIANVVRLQLINKQTFIWIPLIIIAGATLLSILVYALIPTDAPKYGGAGQAPLWYFFAIGLGAMNYTFPFSQAMSITRRDFFLGTMLTAILGSVLMGALFTIGGAIEQATNGYGVNGWMYYWPGQWDAGPFGAFLFAFTLSLFFFVIGFTGATIFKSWGPMALTGVSIAVALVLIGAIFLVTKLELWGQVGAAIGQLGILGLSACGLLVVTVLAVVSFLAFRRAKP